MANVEINALTSELSDVTGDDYVVVDKYVSPGVYATEKYKPGTMTNQDADSVAITGGTINTEDVDDIVDATRSLLLNLPLDVREFKHNENSAGTGDDVSSVMAYIPKFKTSGWPQSALNGLEVGGFWVDVYENSQPDASSTSIGGTTPDSPGTVAGCSRPGVFPWTSISWVNARIAASNRVIGGRNCHMITPFERFAILSLIMRSGQWGQQRGNNDEGKDIRDADSWESYAQFANDGHYCLTGTGPASFWHNGLPGRGIHNLVGNIYEWEDCRIESGLIQPKAYLAGATTTGDTYIDYDDNGNGDGVDVCQLTPGTYTITDATNGNEDVVVERVIITGRFTGRLFLSAGMATDHIDNAVIQLKTAINLCNGATAGWVSIGKLLEGADSKYMALPDFADTSTHAATYLDGGYRYDNSDSRALRRCGRWGDGSLARSGLLVSTSSLPTSTNASISFRSALSIGNL
jgi:hypothetical protein